MPTTETLNLSDPLTYIGHCLCDIATVLDDISHDLRDIQGQLAQREDLESRVRFLECLVHTALFEGEDGDDCPL